MNTFEEKLMDWSQQQFNIQIQSKDSLNLLRTKNGNTFKKLLNFMSNRIKSKENGEQIQRFCHSVKSINQLKDLNDEIKDIEIKISEISSKLLDDEIETKKVVFKDSLNENKEMVSKLDLNAIEKISAKNRLNTQLKPNSKTINDTIVSFEKLFFSDGFDSDETPNDNSSHLLEQINQMMTTINAILYDLNQLKVNKPIKISIDSESVLESLVESVPEYDVNQQTEEETDKKISSINSKLVSVRNLMNKYQTIRSEKLSKNKEKLEKVINSCDEFIQQKRLKCCQNTN